ncbi:hypothetical protein I547_0196 [Mycobacterium kansasii 824]|nr:hypothetical protein I547_0196 [Mycobacterium kansasii 824]
MDELELSDVAAAGGSWLGCTCLPRWRWPGCRRSAPRWESCCARKQAAHSGHVGDYVAWMCAAVTLLGAVLGLQVL